ncbi:putative ATPase [Bacillus sp. V2I10]|nr:putative ATPase [Bacillus sp. V2I10]
MAFPDAVIYSLDDLPLKSVQYADLEHVRMTREFLNSPERYLKHL